MASHKLVSQTSRVKIPKINNPNFQQYPSGRSHPPFGTQIFLCQHYQEYKKRKAVDAHLIQMVNSYINLHIEMFHYTMTKRKLTPKSEWKKPAKEDCQHQSHVKYNYLFLPFHIVFWFIWILHLAELWYCCSLHEHEMLIERCTLQLEEFIRGRKEECRRTGKCIYPTSCCLKLLLCEFQSCCHPSANEICIWEIIGRWQLLV